MNHNELGGKMEIIIRHEVHLHGVSEIVGVLQQIYHQGELVMNEVQEMSGAVSRLEAVVGDRVLPLLSFVGTELKELSDALKAAQDSGAMASVGAIRDRVNALNSRIVAEAIKLADAAAGADITPETPVPPQTDPVSPAPPVVPPVEPPVVPPVEPPVVPPVDPVPPADPVVPPADPANP